jgi:citrate lyase subunit beta/citryl-CoA lyase
MINAGIYKAHGIILDLEDSVAATKKEEARLLVRNALRQVNFYGAERMVRINQLPKGLSDLDFVIPHNVHVVLLPKSESVEHIKQVNEKIAVIKKARNIKTKVYLIPIIESALGVIRAYDIASAADNIAAMAIGLEDYTADLGARRTSEGNESFFARSQLVNACRAAGIQPLDSVFSDIADMEGLRETVLRSKALGFEGMGCIHPRQIKTIHESYAPDMEEIERAKKIVDAFDDATERGLGVVSLGTKMIDPPVVKRAQKVIDIAIALGMFSENERGGNG